MLTRFIVALVLGGILGIERELVRKREDGVRTEMLVSVGSALFAMIAMILPYIVAGESGSVPDIVSRSGASLGIIANIVVGIGFLGAGLIIKTGEHPHGLTTAALVWTTAAIGILTGLGLFMFATFATISIAFLLYILRVLNISERIEERAAENN